MSDPYVMPRFGGVESVVVVGSVLVGSVAGAVGEGVEPGASAGGSVPTLVSVEPAAAPVDEVWVIGSGVPVESVVIDAPLIEPASAATTGDDAYAPLVPAPEDEEDAGEANEYDSRTTGMVCFRFPVGDFAGVRGAVYGLTFATLGGVCSLGGVSGGNQATGSPTLGRAATGFVVRIASTVGAT
jgi:hypothetical protein